jgi:hypothetical protein
MDDVTNRGVVADADIGFSEPTKKLSGDDGDLIRIVAQARTGTNGAWEALIERFGGLVAAVARRCRLSDADMAEVSQINYLAATCAEHGPHRAASRSASVHGRLPLRVARRCGSRPDRPQFPRPLFLIADDKVDPLDAGLLSEEQVRALQIAAERLPPRLSASPWLVNG